MKRFINVVIIEEQEHGSRTQMRAIEDSLETFYSIIHCDYIDIITRRINGVYYNIICDDMGTLKERGPVMVAPNFKEMLVGTIIICPINEENTEELGSFDSEEQERLFNYLRFNRGYDF